MADYYGGQVNYNRIGGYYSGNGGEFTLSSDGGPGLLLDLSGYAAETKNQTGSTTIPSFQTFCVERTEYIESPMEIWVSTTSTTSSVDGSGSHAIYGSAAPLGDDLDPMTAYLYTEFATGTLAGLGYDYTGTTRAVSAGALQNVIWGIEGEFGVWTPAAGLETDFYNAAFAAVNASWTGIGGVRILNSWVPGHRGEGGYEKQDQLYLVPVPAAVLLGMLGLSVAGVKLRKFM